MGISNSWAHGGPSKCIGLRERHADWMRLVKLGVQCNVLACCSVIIVTQTSQRGEGDDGGGFYFTYFIGQYRFACFFPKSVLTG